VGNSHPGAGPTRCHDDAPPPPLSFILSEKTSIVARPIPATGIVENLIDQSRGRLASFGEKPSARGFNIFRNATRRNWYWLRSVGTGTSGRPIVTDCHWVRFAPGYREEPIVTDCHWVRFAPGYRGEPIVTDCHWVFGKKRGQHDCIHANSAPPAFNRVGVTIAMVMTVRSFGNKGDRLRSGKRPVPFSSRRPSITDCQRTTEATPPSLSSRQARRASRESVQADSIVTVEARLLNIEPFRRIRVVGSKTPTSGSMVPEAAGFGRVKERRACTPQARQSGGLTLDSAPRCGKCGLYLASLPSGWSGVFGTVPGRPLAGPVNKNTRTSRVRCGSDPG
jgi:hypothetical protein